MKTIHTLGSTNKRVQFSYEGNCSNGVTIYFEGGNSFNVSSEKILNVLEHFQDQEVRGGFSMTAPPAGGVGEFISSLSNSLTPRHASFICAVMVNEGLVASWLEGNAVCLIFPSSKFAHKRLLNLEVDL